MIWRIYIALLAIALSFPINSNAQDPLPIPFGCYDFTRLVGQPSASAFGNRNPDSDIQINYFGNEDTAEFGYAGDLCLGTDSTLIMPRGTGFAMDTNQDGNYQDEWKDTYSFELLFRFIGPSQNANGNRIITNFMAQNDDGVYLNDAGFICIRSGGEVCGTTQIQNFAGDTTEWIHVSVTRDGDANTFSIYLNGSLEVSRSPAPNKTSTKNNYQFFRDGNGGQQNEHAAAEISYIRLYEEALDATSVEQLGFNSLSGDNIEIVASATEFCGGTEVTLTAQGGARSFYIWSTGDTTSTESLTFTIIEDTTIWVQGVMESPCDRRCFEVADTIHLSVLPTVLPEFEVVDPVCRVSPVWAKYTGDYTDLQSISWSTPGASTSPAPQLFGANNDSIQVYYTTEGTYDITMTTTHAGSGCSRDSTVTITVLPRANTAMDHPDEVCMFDPARFEYIGDATAGATFTWDWDGGIVDTDNDNGRDVYVYWEDIGTKTVTLTIMEGTCPSEITYDIDVIKTPTLDLTAPTEACSGEDVTITYTGDADPSATFTWTVDDIAGQPTDPRAAVFNWETAGTKNLNLQIEEGNCIADTTFQILIKQTPTTTLTAPAEICDDLTAEIEFTGIASPAATFTWGLDGGTIETVTTADRHFTVSWPSPAPSLFDDKEITLSITDDGCTADTTFTIRVNLTPTATVNAPTEVCSRYDVPVEYTGNAPGGATFDWSGDIDNVDLTDPANPIFNWDTDGTKNITLTVEFGDCDATTDFVIEVKPTPSAAINAPTAICSGTFAEIEYTGDASPAAVYTWDFDGGTIEQTLLADKHFEISWPEPTGVSEDKTISLTITDDGCVLDTTFVVSVGLAPTTDLTAPASGCVGEDVAIEYTGNAPGSATLTWTGDVPSAPADPRNPIFNWDSPGDKSLTLTVDLGDCSADTTFIVTINPQPTLDLSAPAAICDDETAHFIYQGNASVDAIFDWGLDGGTITTENTVDRDFEVSWPVPATNSSTKTITLTIDDRGCVRDTTFQLVVNKKPTANFTIDNATVCTGETARVLYTGNADINTATFDWDFDGAISATKVTGGQEAWDLVWDTDGTKNIELIVELGDCVSDPFDVDVTVNWTPVFNYSYADPICNNETLILNLDAGSDLGDNPTFSFTGLNGTANLTAGNNFEITLDQAAIGGTEAFTLTWTNDGCEASQDFEVDINFVPTTTTNIPTEACQFDPVRVRYQGTAVEDINDAEYANFTWDWDGGTPTKIGNVERYDVKWNTPGIKTVNLTIEVDGCTITDSFTIEIGEKPVSAASAPAGVCIGSDALIEFTGTAPAGTTFAWNFGANASPATSTSAGDQTVQWSTEGTKNISLTTSLNGCDSTINFTVDVSEAIDADFDYPGILCVGQDAQFTWTGTGTAPDQIDWTLPAGVTIVSDPDNGKDITFEFSNPGTGIILEAELSRGACVVNETLTLDVFDIPDPSFTTQEDCAGTDLTFTIDNYDAAVTYTWAFSVAPDVFTNNGASIDVRWAEGVIADITLTAENANGCIEESTEQVEIGIVPSLEFTIPAQVCIDDLFQLTLDNYDAAATYNLTFDAGDEPDNGSFDPNGNNGEWDLQWTGTNGGLKTATLSVNRNGCIADTTFTIGIYNVLDFNLSTTQTCVGVIVQMSDNSILEDGLSLNWDFDGGTSTEVSPGVYDVRWATSGLKDITISVVGSPNCPADPITKQVDILDGPDFEITVDGDTDLSNLYICKNDPVTVGLTNLDGSFVLDYSIIDLDGGTVAPADMTGSLDNNFNIEWGTVGRKTLVLEIIDTDPTPAACEPVRVEIDFLVFADPTFEITENNACENDFLTVNFVGVVNTDPSATQNIDWFITDLSTSNTVPPAEYEVNPALPSTPADLEDASFDIRFANAGEYEIRLEISGDCATEFHAETIYIGDLADLSLVQLPTDNCEGESFLFNYDFTQPTFDETSAASYVEWVWTNSNGSRDSIRYVSTDFTTLPDTEIEVTGWTDPGTYNMTLRVNNAGCIDSQDYPIEVFENPVSSFSVGNTEFCSFEEVTFTFDGTAPAGTTFEWEIEDEDNNLLTIADETVQDLSFTFNAPGDYKVRLTLDNNGCIDTYELTPDLIIKEAPDVSIDADATVCRFTALPVDFDYTPFDPGTSPAKEDLIVNWDFTGGVPNADSTAVVYENTGTFTITLSVENPITNCITVDTWDVNVTDAPKITHNAQAQICQYEEFDVTFTINPDENVNFTFDRTVLAQSGNTYTFAFEQGEQGMQSIIATATTQYGCVRDIEMEIDVLPAPFMDITATPTSSCVGQVMTIEYTGGEQLGDDDFVWTFPANPGGAIFTRTRLGGREGWTVRFLQPGDYTINLTATRDGCSTSEDIQIAVGEEPDFTEVDFADQVCEGEEYIFTYTGPYTISNLDVPSATSIIDLGGNSFEIVWNATGLQPIFLTLLRDGCELTEEYEIDIVPIPGGQLINDSFVCQDEPILITYDLTDPDAADLFANYTWTFEGNPETSKVAGEESYYVIWDSPGTYDVSLTVEDNGCSFDFNTTIEVLETPITEFSRPTQICEGDEGNLVVQNPDPNYIYNWNVGEDGVIVSANADSTNLQVRWDSEGVKTVTLSVDNNGCLYERTRQVTVRNAPNASFIMEEPFCLDEITREAVGLITYTGDADPTTETISWDWDDGTAVQVNTDPIQYEVTFTTPGFKTIRLSVSNPWCGEDVQEQTLAVNNLAEFALDDQSGSVCAGVEAIFVFTGSYEAAATLNWDFDDGVETLINTDPLTYSVLFTTTGQKRVYLEIVGDECVGDDFELFFEVGEKPTANFNFTPDNSCIGDPIVFTYEPPADPDFDPADYTFTWEFGPGANVSHDPTTDPYVWEVMWDEIGDKSVSLVVSDEVGCASDATFADLSVYRNDAIEIEADPLCVGEVTTIRFTKGQLEPNAIIDIDFGEDTGDLVTEIIADSLYEVTYNNAGVKTISVDVTGPVYCTNTVNRTIQIEVGERPDMQFDQLAGEACIDELLEFNYTGTSNSADFLWEFDQAPSVNTALSSPNLQVAWDEAGDKTFRLRVANGDCFEIQEFTATINPPLDVEFDLENSYCQFDDMELNVPDDLDPAVGVSWEIDYNGTITTLTGRTQSISLTDAGSIAVTLIYSNFGCLSEETLTANVLAAPDISYTQSATEVCAYEEIQMSFDLDPSGLTFTWEFDEETYNAPDLNAADISVSWPDPGTKTFRVFVSDGSCTNVEEFTIDINEAYLAEFEFNDVYCQGEIAQLAIADDVPNDANFSWTIDYNGTITNSTDRTVDIDLPDLGSLTVSLSMEYQGCLYESTLSADVNLVPEADFSAPQVVCVGENFLLSFEGTQHPGAIYRWDFDDAFSRIHLGNQLYDVIYDEVATKEITLYVELDGCISEVVTRTIAVIESEGLAVSEEEVCVDEAIDITFDFGVEVDDILNYSWEYDGANVISGGDLGTQTLSWSTFGQKTVRLVLEASNCVTDAYEVVVNVIPTLVPEISISIVNYACVNLDIIPEVSLVNEGDEPEIFWYVNDSLVGDTFDPTIINDGDWIQAELYSSYRCLSDESVFSNRVQARISNFVFVGGIEVNPNPVCRGESAILAAGEGNYEVILWEQSTDGSTWVELPDLFGEREITVTPNDNTYYRVLVADEFNICRAYSPAELLEVVEYIPIEVSGNVSMRQGDSRIIEASRGSNFRWEPAEYVQGNPNTARISVSPPETTDFIVRGLTVNGCPDVDTVRVIVTPPLTIANAFTPDGDGINDFWEIPEMNDYPQGEVYIYNRWGRRVFFSIGYNTPWDGRFNGEYLPTGTYYYVIDTKDGYEPYKGFVTVIR